MSHPLLIALLACAAFGKLAETANVFGPVKDEVITPAYDAIENPTPAYDAIENPTPAYDAIENPTPAYDAIENPTPAYRAGPVRKDGPVKEAVFDGPVKEAAFDGPVKEAAFDGPVKEAAFDGPVKEAAFDGPVKDAVSSPQPPTPAYDGVPPSTNPEEAHEDGFEGDILLTPEQKMAIKADVINGRVRRNAVTDLTLKWPNGELIYEFSPNFSEKKRKTVLKAFGFIHDMTGGCVKFIPFNGDLKRYPNRVTIQNSFLSCASNIGRIQTWEKQYLVLSDLCMQMGTVFHEILHTLGFWHEQSRSDRDEYIYVNTTNIRKGMEWNFIKNSPDQIDHLGTRYDYGSVMHYTAKAFAKDYRFPTIVQLFDKDKVEIGQRTHLSANDLVKIRHLYKCW